MDFVASLQSFFRGFGAAPAAPPAKRGKVTRHKREKQRGKITSRRRVTVTAYGEKDTGTYAKLDGVWHYWYDRQWFPVTSLPPGELKDALAEKGIA